MTGPSRREVRRQLLASTSGSPGRLRDAWATLVPGRRPRVFTIVGLAFLGGLCEAFYLLLLARTAFALVNPGQSVTAQLGPLGAIDAGVGTLISLAAILVVVRFLLQAATVRIQSDLYGEVLESTRMSIMNRYLYASWAVQSGDRDGRLQELAGGFATNVAGQMGALISFLVAVCTLVAMLGSALLANAIGTVAAAAAALLLVSLLRPFRGAIRRRSRAAADANVAFNTTVSEAASMAQEVHVFGVQDALARRLRRLARRHRRAVRKFQMLSGLLPAFYNSAALLIVLGGVGVIYLVSGTRLASLGAVLLIGLRSLSYGQGIQAALQSIHAGAPYIEAVTAEQERYGAAEVATGDRPLARVEAITFSEVSYTYGGDRFALESMSFSARRGETIGIVGPSGAGKSTLVQLLLRLRSPSGGRITVDGVSIDEIRLADWTREVVFVPQEAHLFDGTVANNIRFFRDGISDEQVEQAARRAHIHDEIAKWPEGYDTPVGDRGRKLSGGQRQRLTIARALVGEPDVVVLDEPTSSLDVQSEAAIRDTLHEISSEAIVFVIAHRLSTLDLCDRIMVVQAGHLVGFDAPRALEESSDFYREALRLSGLR